MANSSLHSFSPIPFRRPKGQGGLEYLLLLGGIMLVVILAVVILRSNLIGGANQQLIGATGTYLQLVNPCQAISQFIIDANGTNATLSICQAVPPNATVVTVYSLPLTFNGSADGPANMTFSNGNTIIHFNLAGKNNGAPLNVSQPHSLDLYVNGQPLLLRLPAIVGGVAAPAGPDTTPPTLIAGPFVSTASSSATVYFTASEPTNMSISAVGSPVFTSISHSNYLTVHPADGTHTVTGLSPSTAYVYNITLCDQSNNCATFGPYPFTTAAPAAPVITDVSAGVSSGSATITWNTDNVADGTVEYGLSPGVYTSSASNSSVVTNHTVVISPLASSTTYYYRAVSCNAGVCNSSTGSSVTTQAASNPITINDTNFSLSFALADPTLLRLTDNVSPSVFTFIQTEYLVNRSPSFPGFLAGDNAPADFSLYATDYVLNQTPSVPPGDALGG